MAKKWSATVAESVLVQTLTRRANMPPMEATLTAAKADRTPGVRTFYMTSFSEAGVTYTLKVIRRAGRRTTTCTCMDMVHRRFPRRRACKHAQVLRGVIAVVGGVSKVAPGATWTAPIPAHLRGRR